MLSNGGEKNQRKKPENFFFVFVYFLSFFLLARALVVRATRRVRERIAVVAAVMLALPNPIQCRSRVRGSTQEQSLLLGRVESVERMLFSAAVQHRFAVAVEAGLVTRSDIGCGVEPRGNVLCGVDPQWGGGGGGGGRGGIRGKEFARGSDVCNGVGLVCCVGVRHC